MSIKSFSISSLANIWTCDLSSFDWTYDDKETCLLLDEVTVTSDGGEENL